MSNVFKRFTEVVNKPNRAPYDLSFQNNLTMKFGKLYPVFCKEVLPGDSFKIQPTFNFNFMPLVSPVQTRMKATLHFFYVRNRPLWKDFMDWDGMTKEGLTPPYIKLTEQNRDMINTGEIGDFFGIPSRVYGTTYETESLVVKDGKPIFTNDFVGVQNVPPYSKGIDEFQLFVGNNISNVIEYSNTLKRGTPCFMCEIERDSVTLDVPTNFTITWNLTPADFSTSNVFVTPIIFSGDGVIAAIGNQFEMSDSIVQPHEFSMTFTQSMFTRMQGRRCILCLYCNPTFNYGTDISTLPTMTIGKAITSALDVSEKELVELPWASEGNPDGLRLNAFPFRAYEAIYNSFYRDERNNPRMVNGQPEYNKYITTDEGGADTTHYKLFQRNWEPDYLTTAVQSPQQGVAPLVGITSVSAAGTIEITDGNGVTYTAQTKLAEDGDTIQGIRVLSENSPTAVNRALVDLASTGISISDLRNVNALQRWLEINMRRGLRYRDQVKSHYGVDIEFKELQMPEFIGGVNEDVIVNRISQTVETEENPLGSLAGQAGVLGTSKHKISHYCDEKGFIIGIFSIAPVPNYSQNLPKHMIKTSQLDYFTPEFAHIGMQPILNSEVTPLQANLEGKLNDVFGYQRPWYEYLASTDEVHGQFRDSMRRYLINRVYDGTPELGSEFLTIDPETINDVFAVTEDTDKIYGQIWFDVTAKRPIASNVTPRIEP